jgi:glycosyltransferase involved in cell wall biosynthesis
MVTKKKNVLFVIDSLTCGGAEKSLVSLLQLLNRDKYELYLWMRSQIGTFLPLIPNDVKIVDAPKYNLLGSIKLKAASLCFSFILRLNKSIGKHEHAAETLYKCQDWAINVPAGDWDVVIAYQQGVPTYLVADKFNNCKKLAWINVDIFKAGYDIRFNNSYYEKLDYIVPVSGSLHKMLLEKMPQFSNKYHTVYDIINPDTIRGLASKNVQQIKTDDNESIIITVGRLAIQKNYIVAVEAAAELKRRGIKFKWYFIGEGDERANIERKINELDVKKQVILLGLQTNPYAFMRQADIYVQTSSFEGFGLTIAEAKILGKPVVSTNFEVVHNQLTHERNGLISEMNGKSIADNIYRILNDDNLRNSIVAEIKKEENTTYMTEVKKVERLIDA